jgi:hypothetical protein
VLGNFPHGGPHGIFNAVGQVPAKAENCRCQCQPPPKRGMAAAVPGTAALAHGASPPAALFSAQPMLCPAKQKSEPTPKNFQKIS